MQIRNESIVDQKDLNQFNYQNILQPRSTQPVIFKHEDNTTNKVIVFNSGGYISLSVIPHQTHEKKPTAHDRRALFQNRPLQKPKPVGLDWIQEAQQKIQKPKEAGWKFHFSIDQTLENVQKAWDVLVPILINYKVGQTKIVKPENNQIANKIITVYTFNGGPPLDQWDSFLRDTELAFKEAGVVPGGPIYEDRIEGSDYIYYRNDADENGEYVEDAYNFLYKVVDQIPPSDLIMSEIGAELKQSKNVVGCIIKLKNDEDCSLYVRRNDDWVSQVFNVHELKDLQQKDQPQRVTISPIINRDAYIKLLVPQLNKTIPSTNNVINAPDPFKKIDMIKLLEPSKTRSKSQ